MHQHSESFDSKSCHKFLYSETFCSLAKANGNVQAWRGYYNTKLPHCSLGYTGTGGNHLACAGTPIDKSDHALRLKRDDPTVRLGNAAI